MNHHSATLDPAGIDQRVFLHRVPWKQYEALLEVRGESSGVRMTYLEGELELMSPSTNHEVLKTIIARLLEAYAEELDLPLNGYGSWTVKKRALKLGLEPDECYVLGNHEPKRPDLAIEVIWTSGGLDKLEVYRGLEVPEVWTWKAGRLHVHVLADGRYVERDRSQLLPELDLERLLSFTEQQDQTRAVKAWRAHLRQTGGNSG